MTPTHEPIWTHSPTPAVPSDPLDTVVGTASDLVVTGARIVGLCAADTTQITDHTPTTAEEAMDADYDVEGFVSESGYAPTDT